MHLFIDLFDLIQKHIENGISLQASNKSNGRCEGPLLKSYEIQNMVNYLVNYKSWWTRNFTI